MSLNMHIMFLLVSLVLTFPSCMEGFDDVIPIEPTPPTDAGSLSLQTRYDSIRSYPGGGGVFTIAILPDREFAGRAILTINADPALGARLDRSTLNASRNVSELRLQPRTDIEPGPYVISLQVTHNKAKYTRSLLVRVYPWSQYEPGAEMEKREPFLAWLASAHPELGGITTQSFHRYMTYPEILIVEHWTFLSSAWDMRLCFHVMVPPDDGSMILLRRTQSLTPLLAARRESDGSIHEIPIEEYPLLCGY
jgi:hypothetical protein